MNLLLRKSIRMQQSLTQLYNSKNIYKTINFTYTSNRYNSTDLCQKLLYKEYGDPLKVLSLTENVKPSINCEDRDSVLIQMLLAPINPADINTVEGKYPIKPPLPAVPGSEGIGEVIQMGSNVNNLQKGDRVIFLKRFLGTWQTHIKIDQQFIMKVPKDLDSIAASTLLINPCTAYRMLKDFIDLKPNDTVIQNGANSACGQFVIQLCRNWGLKSINIIRDRPNFLEISNELKDLGANYIINENDLRKSDLFKTIPKPRLALNCVGGKNALEMSRKLDDCGVMVTYGGMSREPITLPTSAFIFKRISFFGFWLTKWSENPENKNNEILMLNDLIEMYLSKKLKVPSNYCTIPFHKFVEALTLLLNIEGKVGKKFILSFQD